jgi:hypothetical protein
LIILLAGTAYVFCKWFSSTSVARPYSETHVIVRSTAAHALDVA